MFEWLFKVFSSLSTWLILSSAPELPSSCSNSWCLEGNSLKSSVCSSRSSAFSFLLSERFRTGLSVEAFKMTCQVWFVSSFFRNVGVRLIFFSVFWVLKCTLSFATPVSFWLLLPGPCRHLCLPIPLTFPRAAAGVTSHTHSSSLDLNFSKDSRALCGDAAVFIYWPEKYHWVCGSFFHVSFCIWFLFIETGPCRSRHWLILFGMWRFFFFSSWFALKDKMNQITGVNMSKASHICGLSSSASG